MIRSYFRARLERLCQRGKTDNDYFLDIGAIKVELVSLGTRRKGLSDGEEKGIEKGIEKGQNILVNVIQRLRNGESREDIIKSGVNEKIVDLAEEVK